MGYIMEKQELIKELQKDWEKYWKVKLFDGWIRQKCKRCGKFFWAREKKDYCNDSSCIGYRFLDEDFSSLKKIDYIEAWEKIKKFFVKNNHKALKSYPVVCRWFPSLYFTIASIVDFQRKIDGRTVFSFPFYKIIIPQFCLRFNDIEKVGFSGRHATGFVMVGQHSIYDGKHGYWKDEAIELDYELLTKVLKIKEEMIDFIEDVWIGEGAFGYSLEYFVPGLEIGNCVFTEFLGDLKNYSVMKEKVIDMGAGLERFVWAINKTITQYDAVFREELRLLKDCYDYDEELLKSFIREISKKDIDKISIPLVVKQTLKNLKINEQAYRKKILPRISAYIICDHLRSLLLALSDYAIPSNVGGGYNLRTLIRRLLNHKDNLQDFDIYKLAEKEIRVMKKLKEIPKETLQLFAEIFEREKEKFLNTKAESGKIIEKFIKEKKEKVIRAEDLLLLYQSYGISPEVIEKLASEKGFELEIEKFRRMMEELKRKEKKKEKEEWEKVVDKLVEEGKVRETNMSYYENQSLTSMKANVLYAFNVNGKNCLILDSTIFYPEGGGQVSDKGFINDSKVIDVKKYRDIIVHFIDKEIKENRVMLNVDKEKREKIRKHHSAVHIVNYSARVILGDHVWQAGSYVDENKATIDITHFEKISKEKLEEIEKLANDVVKKSIPIKFEFLKREDAEKKYGFRIYQGGAINKEILRIVNIGDLEIEACGGLHVENTAEIEKIKIYNMEKISDGVIRLYISVGKKILEEDDGKIVEEMENVLGVRKEYLVSAVAILFERWKKLRKALRKEKQPAIEIVKWKEFLTSYNFEKKSLGAREIIDECLKMLGIQKKYLLANIKKFVGQHDEMIEKIKNLAKNNYA
jgi:alanyl-tRNA synthetase